MKIYPLSIILSLTITGCSSNPNNSIEEYLKLTPARTDIVIDERIQNFVDLYNDLESNAIAADTKKTYAESIYFNDTLVTLHSRDELILYLENTRKNLQSIDVKVLNVIENAEDVFIHWLMQTRFKVMGKSSDVKSIGISHLRFDANGQIILHQDYWDSTQGFFQHLPVIGGILTWIKNGLH